MATLLELVGNTPLVELNRLNTNTKYKLYGKLEGNNPGGSVKDRAAYSMIRGYIDRGEWQPGMKLIEATSGNTGIALAMIATLFGIEIELALPANSTKERVQTMEAFGATVTLTETIEAGRDYVEAKAATGEFLLVNQFANPDNYLAHYRTTGPEIWHQTGGEVTHFVSALGTSGTFMGTTRRLKEFNPGVQCISMQPDSPFHGLEGLKHMPTAIVPGIYDPALADDNVWIETEDAYAMTRRLAREEALLCGISSGANLAAACKVGRELVDAGEPGVIVTMLCDSAEKYLSEPFWNDPD